MDPHLGGVRAERIHDLVDRDALGVQRQERQELRVEGLALGHHRGLPGRTGARLDGTQEPQVRAVACSPGGQVTVQTRVNALNGCPDLVGHVRGELLEVVCGGRSHLEDLGVRGWNHRGTRLGVGVCASGQHEFVSDCSGGDHVLAPAVVAVARHLDVVEQVGVGQEQGAALGFGRRESVGDQVEAERRDEHSPVPGQSDAEAADGFGVGDHDDGGAGPRGMRSDEGEQPVEWAAGQRPVDQDEPAVPHVAAQVVDASGGCGHVVVGALVDGHAGRCDRGVQRGGVLETVVADARWVERLGLGRTGHTMQAIVRPLTAEPLEYVTIDLRANSLNPDEYSPSRRGAS